MASAAAWTNTAKHVLEGRTIKQVRYMTEDECEELMWDERALVLELDDGTLVWPSSDEEGNQAGVLFTNIDEASVLPAL